MIITDRLVFLHLHKSGGTFVNAMLEHCVPGARIVGYHYPYREIPEADRHLPVLGAVRNPWAYYVSWYHFQARRQQPIPLFLIVSNNRSLGFAGTISNLVNLARDEPRLELLEASLPAGYSSHGLNLIKRDVADLRAWGGGFYSFLYHRLYAGTEDPIIVRTENLRNELRPALEQLGHLPNQCISNFLQAAPRFNVTRHDAPESYFDDLLAGLVAERDRHVLDRHGYVFPPA